MSVNKKKISSRLISNTINLSKIAKKTEPLSWKINWVSTKSQIYFGNLVVKITFWMMSNKASAHLYTLSNNIYNRMRSTEN